MISAAIKKKLMNNWGDKVEAMDCFAEVKFIDPLTDFSCWVLAMNPEDTDEIIVMTNGYEIAPHSWSFKELLSAYNAEGEGLEVDEEYRPIKAITLYKRLRGI